MKKTILFVDDEDINLFVLSKRFETDYNVLTANCAEDAKRIIEHGSIDALISDLKMPDIDGLDMIKQAKDHLNGVPCFLLTGYDHNEEIEAAIKSKVITQLFKKPYNYNEIQKALEAFL